ncbi:MAG: hypothetical protein R3300_09215 [Candidatus Promineifilaceae bacterium]|nr:hypothetical protein [Candidatus Promineifilaceae bacterium]
MIRKALPIVAVLILSLLLAVPAFARGANNPNPQPVIYVAGQGLAYDSIVTADPLPMNGPFQELKMGGPTGLYTEYGPGDPGYVGGRWWVDNPDAGIQGEMDAADHFFECPLLGPGFEIES